MTSFSTTLGGFLTWDVCNNNLVGDTTFAAIYGLDKSQAAKGVKVEDLLDRIAAYDRSRLARETHEAILSGLPTVSRFDVVWENETRHVIFVGRCLHDPDGMPTFFSGTISYQERDADRTLSGISRSHLHAAVTKNINNA